MCRFKLVHDQVRESEVGGSFAFGLGAFVHALRAVSGRDVAEPAFLWARHPRCRPFGREPAGQRTQVLDELVVHSFRRYADRMVTVGDLAAELEVPAGLQRSRDRVQVNQTCTMWLGLSCPVFASMMTASPSRRAIRSGLPASVAASPRSSNLFCSSTSML